MTRMNISLGILAALAIVAISIVGTVIGWNNRAVALENRYEAETDKVLAVHDNVARIINGKAGVATEYKKGLVEVITKTIEGRKGGDMAKAIHEAAPGLDVSIYRDVANAVEAQRTGFVNAQTVRRSIKQEHDNLRKQFPSSLICGSRAELKFVAITSDATDQAFKTGKDNSDSNPFAK